MNDRFSIRRKRGHSPVSGKMEETPNRADGFAGQAPTFAHVAA
jgi:hypothetical protein